MTGWDYAAVAVTGFVLTAVGGAIGSAVTVPMLLVGVGAVLAGAVRWAERERFPGGGR